MTVGEKIKNARLSRNLTQKQLGELCGMADSAIRRYELGGAKPKLETLRRIAGALHVPLSELCDRLIDIPEIRNEVYGTTIQNMIDSINQGPCCAPKENADKLLKKLNSCIVDGGKIEDSEKLTNFYRESELTLSHEYLNAILNQYSNQSVYDLVELLNYFLSLSDGAQTKVQEYLYDLYEIPVYRSE